MSRDHQMNAVDLLAYLVTEFPDFQRRWQRDDNLFVGEEGAFTAHGVCVEFSHYFVESDCGDDREATANLFRLIETVLQEDTRDASPIANALATCFLENIAGTPAGARSLEFMGPISLKYTTVWGGAV